MGGVARDGSSGAGNVNMGRSYWLKSVGAAAARVLTRSNRAKPRAYQDGVDAFEAGDYATALRLWRLLADQGNATAQFNLCGLYANGLAVSRDDAEAADQGVSNAQFNLGYMYQFGEGVSQDHVAAHMWYTIAASRLQAGEDREYAVGNRGVLERSLNASQVAEAQRLAEDWRPPGG